LWAIFRQERARNDRFHVNSEHVSFLSANIATAYPEDGQCASYSVFTSEDQDCRPNPTITVRWGPVHAPLDLELCEVPHTQWTSARRWLRWRYDPKAPYEDMETLWSSNDRYFDFMELPVEAKNIILEHVVGTQIWPHPSSFCCATKHGRRQGHLNWRWRCGVEGAEDIDEEDTDDEEDMEAEDPKEEKPFIPSPDGSVVSSWLPDISIHAPGICFELGGMYRNGSLLGDDLTWGKAVWVMSLLLVSKHIRSLTQAVIWGSTSKSFRNSSSINAMLYPMWKMYGDRALTKVSLSLSNSDLFRFLGYESKPRAAGLASSRLLHLKRVQYLHLHFREREWSCWFDKFSREARRTHLDCQEFFVNWLLTLVYEQLLKLNNIRSTTISGCMETSARLKWEDIFKQGTQGNFPQILIDAKRIKATPVAQL